MDDTPGSTAADPSVRPRAVSAAAVTAILAAVVNVAIGLLLIASVASTPVKVAAGLVAVVVGISFAFSIALVVFTALFWRGRTWARTALVALCAVSLLTLFAPNALNIAVILLLLATAVLLYRRSVSAWVRTLRLNRVG